MSTELQIFLTAISTTAMVVVADIIANAVKEEKNDRQTQTVTPVHNIITSRPKGFMDYKTGRFVDIDENGKEYFVD